jgi:hypothetical protein
MSVKYPVFTELIDSPLTTSCGEGVLLNTQVFRNEKIVGLSADSCASNIVLAGYMIKQIIVKNNDTSAITITISTTEDGDDILESTEISASSIFTITVNNVYSFTSAKALFIQSASWPGTADLDLYVLMEKPVVQDEFPTTLIT